MQKNTGKQKVHKRVIWWALLNTLLALFIILSMYFQDKDLPNPFWGIYDPAYSYQPQDGPPGKELMDVRPETIWRQYIQDYIQVAGTYPCADSLDVYRQDDLQGHQQDPVLNGKPCLAKRRIVASVQIERITVERGAVGINGFAATISYTIHYSDATQWSDFAVLNPNQGENYLRAYIHLRCWSSVDTIFFYFRVTHQYHISSQNIDNSYSCISKSNTI
jgi:hypothetical protein